MALQKRLKQSNPIRYLTGIEEWDYGDVRLFETLPKLYSEIERVASLYSS